MNFIKKLPFLFILSFSTSSVWASDTDTTPLTDAEALAIDGVSTEFGKNSTLRNFA